MTRLDLLARLAAVALLITLLVAAFAGPGTQSLRARVPKGADFLAFYSGAELLAQGEGAHLYDPARFAVVQRSVADSYATYYAVYPPPLYQAMGAFRRLGYERATQLYLLLQVLLMGAGSWLLVRAIPELGASARTATLLLAASPAAFMNLLTGQAAGIWLCLLGGGLLLLRGSRPLLAGLVLGLLCVKVSIGAAVAAFLILTLQWRALAGFALGGAGLVALSLGLHGPQPWLDWITWMRDGSATAFWPMPERSLTLRSVLGWPLRGTELAGVVAPITALLGGGAALALAHRARRIEPADPRWPIAAGLVLSALLLGLPHLMEYDQGMHGLALLGGAALVGASAHRGLALVLAAAWLTPLAAPLGDLLDVPLAGTALVAALAGVGWASRRRSS